MDPDNPVVKLCIQGMEAEGRGDHAAAALAFTAAWEARTDAYDGCVAAHYLARHQPTPDDALRWNLEALRLADVVGDERVRGFYPSLQLNVGKSLEDVGRRGEARAAYLAAEAGLGAVPDDDGYGAVVRRGIQAGLERTGDGP